MFYDCKFNVVDYIDLNKNFWFKFINGFSYYNNN